jgi:hypothetical protein
VGAWGEGLGCTEVEAGGLVWCLWPVSRKAAEEGGIWIGKNVVNIGIKF